MILADRERYLKSESALNSVVIPTTGGRVLAADPSRTAVTFGSGQSNAYSLFPRTPGTLGTGLLIAANASPFTITIESHGDAVRGEWYAVAAVADVNCAVLATRLVQ